MDSSSTVVDSRLLRSSSLPIRLGRFLHFVLNARLPSAMTTIEPSNRIVQGLWIGSRLSVMEQLSIRSFLAHGHDYHLYVYEEVQDVPKGTTLKDANEIFDKSRIFTYQSGFGKNSYAGFANMFRYKLLLLRGGWWMDSDVVCIRPLDSVAEQVLSSSNEINYGIAANNCVIKTPAKSLLARRLLSECEQLDPAKLQFGQTGPLLLQRIVREEKLEKDIAAPEVFCPIGWRDINRMVYERRSFRIKETWRTLKRRVRSITRPDMRFGTITPATRTIHLWNEVWRNSGIDKNRTYAPSCLYEKLKRQYLQS
jgi:hypothetical protein